MAAIQKKVQERDDAIGMDVHMEDSLAWIQVNQK